MNDIRRLQVYIAQSQRYHKLTPTQRRRYVKKRNEQLRRERGGRK